MPHKDELKAKQYFGYFCFLPAPPCYMKERKKYDNSQILM